MTASRLIRAALLACGLLLTAACSAHNDSAPATAAVASQPAAFTAPATSALVADPNFKPGDRYVKLKQPAGKPAPTGPVRVVEVFSYGCPHCAHFAPYMDALRAALPKDVQVRYMPAVFSAAWIPYAQAFYAARQLGVLHQTHDAFFKSMLQHYPLNSLQDMSAWYGRHGVPPQKFLAAATNATTMHQMAADQHTEIGWGVDATPTLVVGRLANDDKNAPFVGLMRSSDFGNFSNLQQIGLWMVNQVEQH